MTPVSGIYLDVVRLMHALDARCHSRDVQGINGSSSNWKEKSGHPLVANVHKKSLALSPGNGSFLLKMIARSAVWKWAIVSSGTFLLFGMSWTICGGKWLDFIVSAVSCGKESRGWLFSRQMPFYVILLSLCMTTVPPRSVT